jgi:hypothetical protein
MSRSLYSVAPSKKNHFGPSQALIGLEPDIQRVGGLVASDGLEGDDLAFAG